MPTLPAIEDAARSVYAAMSPTPQYAWPLLARRAGCEVWVKHENHTPTGAFKVRGGLHLLATLYAREPGFPGVISATRGNHGQSLAYAARRHGKRCMIVVPEGNSRDKNAAMTAFGAQLVVHGRDFDEAREHAARLAQAEGLRFVGPFEPELVAGVATYALELFRGAPALDTVFVPIGCGSGICGLISARDALGLATRIVGVVSSHANAYAQSFRKGARVETATAATIADGMAVRVPVQAALDIISRGAADVVEVTDAEVEAAVRVCFDDMHQLAEGAGAAPVAALLKAPHRAGKRIGVILSGGNIDRDTYVRILEDVSWRPALV
ncbi:MAG: threonine dehydratase [Betaproteobacteria bacterium]|nr:threonine dehydratase [Betaproteobacteria bacterium]MCC7216433.1 threonine dehydratase [Burkholderiales bacterium]